MLVCIEHFILIGFSFLLFIGISDADLHTITTVENPTATNNRFATASSDDSSQSSSAPMTGLVQPQQPHWPQHNVGSHNHHPHSAAYLDGDDDADDLDYDEFGNGSGPATPNGSSSPTANHGRPKRPNSMKRAQSTPKKLGIIFEKECHFFLNFSMFSYKYERCWK